MTHWHFFIGLYVKFTGFSFKIAFIFVLFLCFVYCSALFAFLFSCNKLEEFVTLFAEVGVVAVDL